MEDFEPKRWIATRAAWERTLARLRDETDDRPGPAVTAPVPARSIKKASDPADAAPPVSHPASAA